MESFSAPLQIIDGNPYVDVPTQVLERLFTAAGRAKSPIPVRGAVNGEPYRQTLVRFRGEWRFYVNMEMLPDSPRRIGETIDVTIEYDPDDRTVAIHPKLAAALADDDAARTAFEALTPSRRKEILRYLASLKHEESVDRNIERTLGFLKGTSRFVGRDSP